MGKPLPNIESEENVAAPPQKKRRWGRILKRLFRVLLLIILGLFILLQLPPVQNYLAQKATSFLSKELHTTVRIDKLAVGLLSGLHLQNFYIEDLLGDTLLATKKLEVELENGLFELFFPNIKVKNIHLEDANFLLRWDSAATHNNLQFLVNYFSQSPEELKDSPNKQTRSIILNINTLSLDRVHFRKRDRVVGQNLSIFVTNGVLHFDSVDIARKKVAIASMNIDFPIIQIEEFWESPPPEAPPQVIETNLVLPPEMAVDTHVFLATIRDFKLTNGRFKLDNYRNAPIKITPPEILDFQHLQVFDIEIDLHDFSYSDWEFRGQVEHISLKDSSGFVLNNLQVEEAMVNCQRTELYGLKIITPYSELGDTLTFDYSTFSDFKEFPTSVWMNAKFKEASVLIQDIIVFAPGLENNTFFKNNQDKIVEIKGNVLGRVNRLIGKDLDLKLGDGVSIKGDFRTRDLNVKDKQVLNLDLRQLRTHVHTLRQLIPGFNPPENFNKLGKLNFSGKFDGFFIDFVANGHLKTEIGQATMNMGMNLIPGRENAKYHGTLSLFGFDLGKWSDNPDFGKITFTSSVKEGKGLTLKTANARLEGQIDSLRFKGYNYQNATMNGLLNQNLFDGALNIKDKNINLTFEGAIDFTDTIPHFDFATDVQKLALRPLNLAKKNITLAGKVDLSLQDIDLSNILGEAKVSDFQFIKDKVDTFRVESLKANSYIQEGKKHFEVESDVLNADLVGTFDIEEIPETLLQFFEKNYPDYARRTPLKSRGKALTSEKFDYQIYVKDTKNWTYLANPKLDRLQGLSIRGHFNNLADSATLDIDIPYLRFDNIAFSDVVLMANIYKNETDLNLSVYHTKINNKQELAPIAMLAMANKDTVIFAISSINLNSILDNLNLNGMFFLEGDEHYQVQFFPSDLVLKNEKWAIHEDNYIRFKEGYIETQDFVMENKDRRILLESMGSLGLKLKMENLDLDFVNNLWTYDKLNFQGSADITATAENIFRLSGLAASVEMDTLWVNGDDWGIFDFQAKTNNIREKINASLSISRDNRVLAASGFYNAPSFEIIPNKSFESNQKNYLDFGVELINYPLDILEYFIGESITNTVGLINAQLNFKGPPNKPDISGQAQTRGVATTINVLQTRYIVPEAEVRVNNKLVDATGSIVYDEWGNEASVTGGITHDHFRNFGLDVRVATLGEEFLGLKTIKKDNPYIYGTALGHGYAQFSGTFRQAEIYINATSSPGTNIVIPVSYDQEATEVNFITFLKQEEEENPSTEFTEIRGVNVEMDFEITEDAAMQMIFDQQWGDVISGKGTGNLKVIMTRNGGFEMHGDYEVSEGEYLFTLMNLFINKPFTVERGGTIKWSGDPYNADINLNAVYKNLSTSVANFIQEYIATAPSEVQQLARNPTNVDLKMLLTGKLLTPKIGFDINFPSLSTELKNYTDSKLRTIRQDENELNRQVFGLLVLGQFLPTQYNLQAKDLGINTLSEMIANQLSIYVTELVSEWIADGGIISGIDFDFSYNQYQFQGFDSTSDDIFSGNELQGRLKLSLGPDSRWSVVGGVRADIGDDNFNTSQTNDYFAGEFMIEYILTKDRRLKVQAYNRNEPDIGGGRRNKSGVGLSFRKEFDSLQELFESRKKK